jgi:hypothetical protein
MNDFIYYYSYNMNMILALCASIIGIIFWKKQRTKESMVFVLGILIAALGPLIKIISVLRQTLSKEILSPELWHIGSVITSIGLIVTVVGFALVTWKIKRNT